MQKKRLIGFTTTIPVEVLFAGGYIPCDLNNIFITDKHPMRFIERAERDGFPKSMCNWIKGIYGVITENDIPSVITVMEGDCSNTQALAEILTHKGVNTIHFSYPFDRDKMVLKREIEKLSRTLSVDKTALLAADKALKETRSNLAKIDRMTWFDKLVTGYENHLWLVRSSDMLGDNEQYNRMAVDFIASVRKRKKIKGINIGYIGVPPIVLDLYDFMEGLGAHIVYNETQRQFSLPYGTADIIERYLCYTYPYGIFARINDMKKEIKRRKIRGIIHYVQAFCYRIMEDVILRDMLGIPVLTIEGDLPKRLDARTKLRLEAFIEMLKGMSDGDN